MSSRLAFISILVTIILVLPSFHGLAAGQSAPIRQLATGLSFPVSLAFAPDGRIFFNEKNSGSIRIIQNNTLLEAPFANVAPIVVGPEQGLLGIALDPSFSSNKYVYVYYTQIDDRGFTHGKIGRFSAAGNSGTNPVTIFDVNSSVPFTGLHNGGYIKFGPDGKLYAQVGEFHTAKLAQELSSYAGKILRMNPDGSVPGDNPFPNSLVYAYGIRNGFGFTFDHTGRLIETEAGTDRDEINIIVPGGNYGWPDCLGKCNDLRYVDPITTLGPPAVTPTGIAELSPGVFLFGQYTASPQLQLLELRDDGTVASISPAYSLPSSSQGILAVERAPDGNVYFTTLDSIYVYQNLPLASTSSTETSTSSPTSSASTSTPPSQNSLGIQLAVPIVLIIAAGLATYLLLAKRKRHAQRAGAP